MAAELHPPDTLITTTAELEHHPPKRQRRPSVRLGDPPYDSQPRRSNKTWRFHKDPSLAVKTSKTRPLTNLVNGGDTNDAHRKGKIRKATKKGRSSNWSTIGNGGEEGGIVEENEEFREFEAEEEEEGSDHSPVNSVGLGFWDQQRRRGIRVSEEEEKAGVREWLIGLGLGRYAPVFEIHEVDHEILPMLTLEDLKDMGINAVGSRRKMYASILNLRKGFS